MSAAQHLALINTIMEIGANYKWPRLIKNNLSNFERRGNLIIVIYSHTVVTPLCCKGNL
jgi:hypothetical protein